MTVYFWWKNIQGIHESSERALQIMKITTVMVVMLIVWCLITIMKTGAQLPPLPSPADMHHDRESLGWLLGTWAQRIPLIMLLVGFGHSVLAMSGEESLAQVNREIEHPKLKNLEKTGLVIFLYSLFFTSLVSFFAVMIIPDGRAVGLLRQPDQRTGDECRRALFPQAGVPGLRGAWWAR